MKKILVAEDSSVIQNLTKRILQNQNYQIESAKNGKKVMDAVNKNSYDLILMDINMPVMDGIACTKAIRALKDPTKKDIPIIAITGNAQNMSMDDFKSAGMNDFLPKPLNFDALVDMVNKHLT